jgi:TatD DNase family protein
MAHEFVKLNLLIGVGGVVTFKNGQKLKEVVQELDAKHLVTETDAPYLTPVPYRGKTNYPKYIPLIASEIAEIKNMSLDELMNQILANTKILFNIK